MNHKLTQLSAALLLSAAAGTANGAVVASTTFDGQTIAGNTASNLGWALNGVDDPGSMSAFVKNTATTQGLFNTNTFNQNQFAPQMNTGNGNTWWRTSVDLKVSAGNSVFLTDVAFDYWSLNGGGVQNVGRRSDFTITLYDPSNAAVAGGSVSILDVFNGAPQTTAGLPSAVSLPFASAVALSAPGTYRLEIDGGELGGVDETGNHTGIDNLSINGTVTVSAIPEPSSAALLGLGGLALILRRRK